MAKKNVSIQVIVHFPQKETGKRELARKVTDVHTDMVHQYIQKLNCPSRQKSELLNTIMKSVSVRG